MRLPSDSPFGMEGASLNEPRFALTPPSLILAGRAVAIARREIDEVEFHTRLGADAASADEFLSSVGAATSRVSAAGQDEESAAATLGPNDGTVVVGLDLDELTLVNNALNEILNGLREEDTADLRDDERAAARMLLRTVNTAIHDARRASRLAVTAAPLTSSSGGRDDSAICGP